MGVAKTKPHPYLANNAFPGTWRPNTKILPDWSLINFFQPKKTSCGCIYEKNYTHYHARMNFIPLFIDLTLRSSFIGTFLLYTPMGRGRGIPPILLPKSSCVCIPCLKSVAPRACLAKVPFLAFFGPDIKIEMGVVKYIT